MGRNKIPTEKKIKRLDVYIESQEHEIILKNKLLPEIIKLIKEIAKR
jgi:hypothetical protein